MRRRSADRRALHQDVAAALQMPHDSLRGNRGRHAVAVVDTLLAGEQEREGDRFGDVAGVSFWSSKRVLLGDKPSKHLAAR